MMGPGSPAVARTAFFGSSHTFPSNLSSDAQLALADRNLLILLSPLYRVQKPFYAVVFTPNVDGR
jgi:hypothetical protein